MVTDKKGRCKAVGLGRSGTANCWAIRMERGSADKIHAGPVPSEHIGHVIIVCRCL